MFPYETTSPCHSDGLLLMGIEVWDDKALILRRRRFPFGKKRRRHHIRHEEVYDSPSDGEEDIIVFKKSIELALSKSSSLLGEVFAEDDAMSERSSQRPSNSIQSSFVSSAFTDNTWTEKNTRAIKLNKSTASIHSQDVSGDIIEQADSAFQLLSKALHADTPWEDRFLMARAAFAQACDARLEWENKTKIDAVRGRTKDTDDVSRLLEDASDKGSASVVAAAFVNDTVLKSKYEKLAQRYMKRIVPFKKDQSTLSQVDQSTSSLSLISNGVLAACLEHSIDWCDHLEGLIPQNTVALSEIPEIPESLPLNHSEDGYSIVTDFQSTDIFQSMVQVKEEKLSTIFPDARCSGKDNHCSPVDVSSKNKKVKSREDEAPRKIEFPVDFNQVQNTRRYPWITKMVTSRKAFPPKWLRRHNAKGDMIISTSETMQTRDEDSFDPTLPVPQNIQISNNHSEQDNQTCDITFETEYDQSEAPPTEASSELTLECGDEIIAKACKSIEEALTNDKTDGLITSFDGVKLFGRQSQSKPGAVGNDFTVDFIDVICINDIIGISTDSEGDNEGGNEDKGTKETDFWMPADKDGNIKRTTSHDPVFIVGSPSFPAVKSWDTSIDDAAASPQDRPQWPTLSATQTTEGDKTLQFSPSITTWDPWKDELDNAFASAGAERFEFDRHEVIRTEELCVRVGVCSRSERKKLRDSILE